MGARRGEVVHHARRPLESLFGEVHLDHFAAAEEAATVDDFALDGALNLPAELYSLPVRQRGAEHGRSVSMEQTVQGIDRTTGAHVPKRQVEALVVRAAVVFEASYARRPAVANDTGLGRGGHRGLVRALERLDEHCAAKKLKAVIEREEHMQ